MSQRFSNNAATTLAEPLTDTATSLVVADAAGFVALGAGETELVTLEAGALREILRVTARSGTTWTVTRAIEGTTARAWSAGVAVQARLTAGTLGALMAAADHPDVSGLDHAGNARGAGAVNLQSGRAAVDRVASGEYSLTVGRNTKASATDATAIGVNASATGPYSVALGSNAASSGQGGFAVGYASSAAGVDTVSIGANSAATNAESVAIGSLSQSTGSQSVAIGKAATATGHYAVALGRQSSATGQQSLAIGNAAVASDFLASAFGNEAVASAFNSAALGNQAVASADAALAVGSSALASGYAGVALGVFAKAVGSNGVAIGNNARAVGLGSIGLRMSAFAARSIASRGYWSIPTDDWNDQSEEYSAGVKAAFATPFVDLGAAPVWQASAVYAHGDVVRPTAGGTVQYRAWCDWDAATGVHNAPTSTATEPTWPGAGGSEDIDIDGNNSWVGIDWFEGYETEAVPAWLTFHPTEILFVCQQFSALTGTPNISIGTPSAPTAIVNADDVPMTGALQSYRFTLPNPSPGIAGGEPLLITLNAAASAGKCLGRFVVSGFFVEAKSRAL